MADLLASDASQVRLLTETEWVAVAGGTAEENRYPWDPPSRPITRDEAAILTRANTYEVQLDGTSPVAMYPAGASQPHGLMDLAGNVWEWTATAEGSAYVVRGGSWLNGRDLARVAARFWLSPSGSGDDFGVRLASPVLPP